MSEQTVINKIESSYISIPDEIIKVGSKYASLELITYCYIATNSNHLLNCMNTSLFDIVSFLGKKPKNGNGNINSNIKNALLDLKKKELISFNENLISGNKCFRITINDFTKFDRYTKKDSNANNHWTRLYYDEYLKIINSDYKNKDNILMVLCWIKLKQNSLILNHTHSLKYGYTFFTSIEEELFISQKKLPYIFSVLEQLGFIYYRQLKSNSSSNANNKTTFFCVAYVRLGNQLVHEGKSWAYNLIEGLKRDYVQNRMEDNKNIKPEYYRWISK